MKRLTSRCAYSQSQDPQASRLVVVTGAAAQDRMREARSRNDVSRFQDRATAEFLAGEAANIRPMSLCLGVVGATEEVRAAMISSMASAPSSCVECSGARVRM